MVWVETIFTPEHSWKKRADLDSFGLAHEQTHFNITELFARRLRKTLIEEIKSEKKGVAIDLLLSKIDSTAKRTWTECEEMQDLYDKQTNHHMNKSEQKIKWNSSIWESLGKLSDWAINSFFIEKVMVYKD